MVKRVHVQSSGGGGGDGGGGSGILVEDSREVVQANNYSIQVLNGWIKRIKIKAASQKPTDTEAV
jgi:hypothetical protein